MNLTTAEAPILRANFPPSMKRHLTALLSLLLLFPSPPARAAIVHSGIQNIAIPYDFNGVFLRIDTGTNTTVEPSALNWSTQPWVNPFFGGTVIGNSPLFLPVITGADQIVKLAGGTVIDAGSNFAAGESGSSSHVGPAANQFQVGSPGYIGYKFQLPGGGPDYFGWMGIQVNDAGAGTIVDWAYQNTAGTAIQAGAISPVPEPAEACCVLLLALAGACTLIRRRRQREECRHAH